MSTATATPKFGKWRARFWPVFKHELKKLIPMALLLFFILFNYTVLRDTKDTLVVSAADGSHVIPFLKVWGVIPMAMLFMIIYAKLSNKLSKSALFYSVVSPFILFFAVFAWILYPLRDSLEPTSFVTWLQSTLPVGFSGVIAMIKNWSFSLFYVMSELWGSMAISLLFWGFANEICKISEAKRFFAIFGTFANLALILSGRFIKWSSNLQNSTLAQGTDPFQISLNYMTAMIVFAGAMILGIYWWINKYVLTDTRFYDKNQQTKSKKSKPKLSIKESFLFLAKSKYLGCIAMLVLAYGVAINLVEVTWKNQIYALYPTKNAYSAYMGGFSEMTGYITMLVTFFLGGATVRKLGWSKTALITPIIILLTGVAFFGFTIFKDNLMGFAALFGTTPLVLGVMFGKIQNIASKSTKYAFFDPTKEMAYIPLDQETKVKGKAAVDVVGARLGKGGGALVQQGLIIALGGSVSAVVPYVGVILMGIIALWMIAARSLGKQFAQATAKTQEDKKSEVEEVVVAPPQNTAREAQTTS